MVVPAWPVAEQPEQRFELVAAAVHVADDVERTMLVACRSTAASFMTAASTSSGLSSTNTWRKPSRPSRSDRRTCDCCWRMTCGPKCGPFGPSLVALLAEPFGQVEHDGDRQAVVFAGKLDQRLAGLRLYVGGVDDGQPCPAPAAGGDVVQECEGFAASRPGCSRRR